MPNKMDDSEASQRQSASSLAAYFSKGTQALPTEDVLHVMLPLMRTVASLHEKGRVAALGLTDVKETEEGHFALVDGAGVSPKYNQAMLRVIQPRTTSGLKIIGEYRVTNDASLGTKVEDLRANSDVDVEIKKPIFLTNLRSWEQEIGHHDEITDIFQLGMIMACIACGINPRDADSVESFSSNHANLFAIQPQLHPVLGSIIVEATALNRHERATDLASLIRRLETYRDQPVSLDVERVLSGATGVPGRRKAVLSHLRDRLFDLSRRNRLIYFRPTQSSVNLTEASVPIVMRLESVRSEQLCTWGGPFARNVLAGKAVPLNTWLRFEDQPQLPSGFDRIIQETRRDRSELGFSPLRLVVGFLRWHNLKDAPNERISSPLLWLPVEISKTKGVRDQFVLRCPEPIAEFNPALRHMLRQLYDIQLPETADLSEVSLEQIHADLLTQIQKTEPGVRLELQQRPQIRLIHQRAVQRVNQYTRRRGLQKLSTSAKADFSYERDDYRPLGLALFEKFVKPSPLPQRLAAGGAPGPKKSFMVAETEALTYESAVDEGHRYSWEVDLTQVTLANFNYKKMSLVRDFAELIERPQSPPAFDQVFSIEPRPFVQETPPPIPIAEQWNVVAADATQDTAVAIARSGRSFIIQGPPGTGKSQTITNLIADYAGRGKRVLFVCEKRAALDVVFHRLGQAGLDGLSCIIHDAQEDKKAFIQDIKTQYEKWGKSHDGFEKAHAKRSQTTTELTRSIRALEEFDAAVGNGSEDQSSLRSIVRRAAALPPVDGQIGPKVRERLPELRTWDANRQLVEKTARLIRDNFGLSCLADHPFAYLNEKAVRHERPFEYIETKIDDAEALLLQLDPWLEGGSVFANPAATIGSTLEASRIAQELQETGLGTCLELLDPSSQASLTFQQDMASLQSLQSKAAEASNMAAGWVSPLSADETEIALDLAKAKETSLLRFFSGSWRSLQKTVRERYNFASHAIIPSVTNVLEKLKAWHEAEKAVVSAKSKLEARLGTQDLSQFVGLREKLLPGAILPQGLLKVLEAAKAQSPSMPVIAHEAALAPTINRLFDTASDYLDDVGSLSFARFSELLRDLREGLDDLPDFLPILTDIHAADSLLGDALRSLPLPLPAMEALVLDEAIARIERHNPEVRRFDIERLMTLTRNAAVARDLLRSENASAINATLHRQFREHVKTSEMSVTNLDTGARLFKKRYANGRRELEHEFGKTMRYRSIRDLASSDTGLVVNDLKPIWLMSPLSVSDTLPLEQDLFDVVIFDEASQITTEEAVPTLCRSGQVIVVGDEMQLPPTNFFSTSMSDDEMEVVAEEDGEKIAILLDADSLLNQSARNLPATLLAWHYRSRFESLISFSNAAFYEGQLITIPDQSLRHSMQASEPVKSNDLHAVKGGVDRLLHFPITTHRIADGIYDKRTNPPEARYIAELVREILLRKTGQSIGIVAFSEAQQTEIENALDQLGIEDNAFAIDLEREYVREDDGQFNGLFVKNLENVQGDERDIILMSVCYAPGRDGRMVMNFGPINQRGGEKRLNVIFSRARRHMAIVSTIPPEAITNVHNDGARALRSFLSFAEAQSKGASEHAQAVLSALNPSAAKTFGMDIPMDPVRTSIATALRELGHVVHEHVGGASFRCDLAIVNEQQDGYRLGILLDREGDSKLGVEARFLFRPKILRAFGWRVLDVPVSSWQRSRSAVINRIEAELYQDSWELTPIDAYSSQQNIASQDDQNRPSSAMDSEDNPEVATEAHSEKLTEFRFAQGTSNKFWKVGLVDSDLIVEFGRVGTKGQRVVKTFESPERAKREATKLILEKTQKGYEEFG